MTAVELIKQLQLEADEMRKQKKRQNVTGLHKSVPPGTLLSNRSSSRGTHRREREGEREGERERDKIPGQNCH